MRFPYDSKTALVVVDVQNDFADPAGSLSVRDGAEVVAILNEEIAAARAAGAFVTYTQDWHPEVTPHFAKDGGIWPVHCLRDTWGAALHPDLAVVGPCVRKGAGGEDGYSGFTMRDVQTGATAQTELGDLLGERGIERVVIAGLATDYCVKETAVDAVAFGYETYVLAHAVRAVDLAPGDGERALQLLHELGAVVIGWGAADRTAPADDPADDAPAAGEPRP